MLARLFLLVGITTGSWSPKEAGPPLACLDSGACYQVCLGSAEKRRIEDNVLCEVVLIMASAIIHVHHRVSGRRPAWEKNLPPFKVSPKIDIIMITMTTRMLIIRVKIISSYFFWALPKLPLPSAHPPARNLGNFFTFEKVSNLSRALSPPFVQCPKEMVFFSGKSALRLCC